jgi:hypothetical protein
LESLDIVATTAGNMVIEGIARARASIADGRAVANPCPKQDISMVAQMINAGKPGAWTDMPDRGL